MLRLQCTICLNEFMAKPYRRGAKFCSQKCYGKSIIGKIPKSAFIKGHRVSPETEFKKGKDHKYFGKSSPAKNKHWKLSLETKKKMSKTQSSIQHKKRKGYKMPNNTGEKNWRWIKDRTKIKQYWKERNNSEYKQWRKKVWLRDTFKCRLTDKNCKGKIIAHHILSWREYQELRYEVNNGITLCNFHHPRKRKEEKDLIPIFQKLINISLETTR